MSEVNKQKAWIENGAAVRRLGGSEDGGDCVRGS